jgi:hypothetical protein
MATTTRETFDPPEQQLESAPNPFAGSSLGNLPTFDLKLGWDNKEQEKTPAGFPNLIVFDSKRQQQQDTASVSHGDGPSPYQDGGNASNDKNPSSKAKESRSAVDKDKIFNNLKESHEKQMLLNTLWGKETAEASIKPEAVKQNQFNDCFLMSSIAAVAKTHPELIKDMIKPLLGVDGKPIPGAFTVTFPGDKEHPVNVYLKPDDLEHYARIGSHGSWPIVLEQAYENYKLREGVDNPLSSGDPIHALGLLTGKKFDSLTMAVQFTEGVSTLEGLFGKKGETRTVPRPVQEGEKNIYSAYATVKAEVRAMLEREFAGGGKAPRGELIASKGEEDLRNQNKAERMYPGHGYTVTGYDPRTSTVTLFNPQNKEGQYGSTFQMSLDTFVKTYSKLVHERR